MISRASIYKQTSKGGKMPKGPGTYGSQVGRPKKKLKYKKGGTVKKYNTGGSVKKGKKK
jgi:hypothetical protein